MRVGVITTSRADYSIYYPLLKKIDQDNDLELTVFATGMHIGPLYGETVNVIKQDGFNLVCSEDILVFGDSPKALAQSMGKTTSEIGRLLEDNPQDLMICLGDRFEMFAGASAVVPFKIPIIHLHGGEITVGAIDEKFRHAISKLSDYHITSCEEYRLRVIQLGVHPSRVFNFGALGIENISNKHFLSKEKILEKFKIEFKEPSVLVTYQPVTTEFDRSEYYIDQFCSALEKMDYQFIITLGNADTTGLLFIEKFKELGEKNPKKYKIFESLGLEGYHSVMNHCQFVLGNSSSGIIEAASLNKVVINVGNRQLGRATSENVIHCREDENSIINATEKVPFVQKDKFENIYFQNGTSSNILKIIKSGELTVDYQFYNQPLITLE